MSARLHISEVLEKLREFTGDGSVQKKINWLQQNDSPTLRMLLQHNFDPNIHYNLPEGDPPFRANEKPFGLTETHLLAETRKISYLWLAPYDATLAKKVEAQAIELAKYEQVVSETTKKQTEIETDAVSLQSTYDDALKEHEAQLTVLADLETKIIAAKKAVDISRTIMAQAKVRLQTAQQQHQEVTRVLDNMQTQLSQRRAMHKNDKERLKRQPAAAPMINAEPAPKDMPRHRLEMMFIQTLEAMHPNEAKVLLSVKNKALSKNYPINKEIVKKAFPTLLK